MMAAGYIERAETPLWPADLPPCALGQACEDIPTIQAFLPSDTMARHSVGAIAILPGGGYSMLAQHEGVDFAKFLAMHGVASFVVKYRLGSNGYRYPTMLLDAARAIKTIRVKAEEFGIDSGKIGIMGSSAGGHLAATLMTHWQDDFSQYDCDKIDSYSAKPDFGILCYPVISMQDGLTHIGSRNNLLGANPTKRQKDELSADQNVTSKTPQCFIWHTWADRGVNAFDNSVRFASALNAHGVPCSLHIYPQGRHGLGLGCAYPFLSPLPWANELLLWLRELNLIP